MKAKQALAMKSASSPAPFVPPLATTAARLGQHLKNLRALQAQYDTMLYMVELMVSFDRLNIRNPGSAKTAADLKSLVIQERNELGLRQAENTDQLADA